MKLSVIAPSNVAGKKWMATFIQDDGSESTTHFGATGYEDYTQHKSLERKNNYLARHKSREDWNNPITAGALSRWILWNKKSLVASIKDYINRFDLA